jgi:uncharacterized protein DUF3303
MGPMSTYAVAFKFDEQQRDEVKKRRGKISVPKSLKIISAYKIVGENKGGLIVEGDHDGIQQLVRQWRDLLKFRITPVKAL